MTPPAFAQAGPGYALIFLGLPYAALVYLTLACVLICKARRGERMERFALCVFGAPLWALLFVGPWEYLEKFLAPYEVAWSFALPSVLLFAAAVVAARKTHG
jgi:hypothetical protein